MAATTKVYTSMMSKKDLEKCTGQMAVFIEDNGMLEFKTDLES